MVCLSSDIAKHFMSFPNDNGDRSKENIDIKLVDFSVTISLSPSVGSGYVAKISRRQMDSQTGDF